MSRKVWVLDFDNEGKNLEGFSYEQGFSPVNP